MRPTVVPPERLAFEVRGPRGAPYLVLLHSLGTNRTIFDNALAAGLAARFRVVLVDLPGHGHSLPASSFEPDALVAQLIALFDELRIERALLAGQATGGAIALRMAAGHPERVHGVVVSSPGVALLPAATRSDLQVRLAALADTTRKGGAPALWDTAFYPARGRHLTPRWRAGLSLSLSRTSADTLAATLSELVARSAGIETITGLKVPALFLVGAHDAASIALMQRARDGIVSAGHQAVLVPDCGELVPIEEPAFFARTIREFAIERGLAPRPIARSRHPLGIAAATLLLAAVVGGATVLPANGRFLDGDSVPASASTDPTPTPIDEVLGERTTRPSEAASTPTPEPRMPTVMATPEPATPEPVTPTPTPPVSPTAAPSAPAASERQFALPGDGAALGQSGWFPGGASTVTLRDAAGNDQAHAYWFRWSGQAYDAPRDGLPDSMYPDIRVLVADASLPRPAHGAETTIMFSASELVPGASKSVTSGRFTFTVTITSATLTTYGGAAHVWGSDLRGTITID